VPPLPEIEDRESLGLLDPDALYAWESNLTGKTLDDWRTVKRIVLARRGNFRACVLSLIMMAELEDAREDYLEARNVAKKESRADRIANAGRVLQVGISSLDDAWIRVRILRRDLANLLGDGPINFKK